jgi:hypothetical protein
VYDFGIGYELTLGVKVGTHVRTQNRVKMGLFWTWCRTPCVLFRDMKIVTIEHYFRVSFSALVVLKRVQINSTNYSVVCCHWIRGCICAGPEKGLILKSIF